MSPVRSKTITRSKGARNQHVSSPARARGQRRFRTREPEETRPTSPAIVNVADVAGPQAQEQVSVGNKLCLCIGLRTTLPQLQLQPLSLNL